VKTAAYLPLGELDEAGMLWLRRFEPFGPLNENPIFCADDVELHDEPRVVGEKHLKFSVSHEGGVFDAIAFNLGHMAESLRQKKRLRRIAFHPEWNVFRGRKKIQLRVIALE
jgi:single-stranded-DNA-specific exonuclease